MFFTLLKSSAILLLFANSGTFLQLSIIVHYKTECNDKVLSVNYNFNLNYLIDATFSGQ